MRISSKLVPIVKPYTRKRECVVQCDDKISLYGTYWDGGSRSEYRLVDISSGRQLSLSYSVNPPQFGGYETTVDLQRGQALIKFGTFCGKPATCYVTVLPCDLPKILGLHKDDSLSVFLAAIDSNPSDPLPIGMLADRMEESAHPYSQAVREAYRCMTR